MLLALLIAVWAARLARFVGFVHTYHGCEKDLACGVLSGSSSPVLAFSSSGKVFNLRCLDSHVSHAGTDPPVLSMSTGAVETRRVYYKACVMFKGRLK